MSAPTKTQEQLIEEKRKEFIIARNVYLVIIVSFLSVCTVAIIVTSKIESEKTGFRAIETEKPVWFIDKTYMKKSQPTE